MYKRARVMRILRSISSTWPVQHHNPFTHRPSSSHPCGAGIPSASRLRLAHQYCHLPVPQVFFCKYNDPSYVKMEKLDIMTRLVDEKNIDQVGGCWPLGGDPPPPRPNPPTPKAVS